MRIETLYRLLNVCKGEAKTVYTIEKESTESLEKTRNYFNYLRMCGVLKTEYVIAHGERVPHYSLSDKGVELLDSLEQIYNIMRVM